MKGITHLVMEPWIIIGDFNSVMTSADRKEWQPVKVQEVKPFVDCVEACRLQKIKWLGDLFTWCNRHSDNTRIRSRIDWALVN